MKNLKCSLWAILCAFVLAGFNITYAATRVKPGLPTLSSGKWKDFKVSELVKLSFKDIHRLRGKKMNITEKISFAIMKKNMKHAIKENPTISVGEYYASLTNIEIIWLIVIIVLALLLLLVMIALLGLL